MTELNLEEIEARVNSASEEPWSVDKALESNEYCDVEVYGVKGVAQTVWFSDSDMAHTGLETMTREDAEFIAHARQDVPALLAYIEKLEQEVLYQTRTAKTACDGLGRYEKRLQRAESECDELKTQIERLRDALSQYETNITRSKKH